jgi:hypothetical protein
MFLEGKHINLYHPMFWLKDLNVDSIMFELNSKSGVNQVNSHMFDLSEFGSIIQNRVRLKSVFYFQIKLQGTV